MRPAQSPQPGCPRARHPRVLAHHLRNYTVDIVGSRQIDSVLTAIAGNQIAGVHRLCAGNPGPLWTEGGVGSPKTCPFGTERRQVLLPTTNGDRSAMARGRLLPDQLGNLPESLAN